MIMGIGHRLLGVWATGAEGYTVNSGRTSESGFDTNGATAMTLKKYVAATQFIIQYCLSCIVIHLSRCAVHSHTHCHVLLQALL